MDAFKLDVGSGEVWSITRENLDKATKRRAPWYQPINGHNSWFAVCPVCDNPIQIIGMMEGKKPFGKHFLSQKAGVAVPLKGCVDRDEYEWCPYACKNKTLNRNTKRHSGSKQALLIKNTLIENFDRVIYILQKTSGLRISDNLAEQMLKDYRAVEGWRYRGATVQNIPWTFAYMMQARKLFGRVIEDDSLARSLCENYPELEYNNKKQLVVKVGGRYCPLQFSFIHHRRHITDQHTLTESIEFNIADAERQTVCKKSIIFDHAFFLRLINSKNETWRKTHLIALARRILD